MKKQSKKFKKKILIYFPSIENGGVETNFFNIINNKKFQKNIDFKIITFNYDKRLRKYKNKVLCVFKNFNIKSRIVKLILSFLLLIYYSNKNKIIFSFQSSILAIIASKLKGSKVIIRLNTSPYKYIDNFIKKKIFSFFYLKSNYIICNSIAFKIELKKLLNVNAIYINNLINFDKVKKLSSYKIKDNFFKNFSGVKILSIGRLTDQKNFFLSLRVISKIYKKFNLKYLILGSGHLKNEIEKFIKKNNLSKVVKLVEFQQNPYPFIRSSDIILLTSKYEGMPNVLLEAILLKKIFISSDCPTGPKEVAKISKNQGILFKNNSPESLKTKLISIIKNKKFLKKSCKVNKNLKPFSSCENLISLLKRA